MTNKPGERPLVCLVAICHPEERLKVREMTPGDKKLSSQDTEELRGGGRGREARDLANQCVQCPGGPGSRVTCVTREHQPLWSPQGFTGLVSAYSSSASP